jgi:hypothetical protein
LAINKIKEKEIFVKEKKNQKKKEKQLPDSLKRKKNN